MAPGEPAAVAGGALEERPHERAFITIEAPPHLHAGDRSFAVDEWHLATLRDWGAERVPHDDRVLYRHLINVHLLARAFSLPSRLTDACLFHVAYGCDSYPDLGVPTLSRETVRTHIGDDAELIVYKYCHITEKSLYMAGMLSRSDVYVDRLSGGPVPASRAEHHDLMWMYFLNAVEQDSWMKQNSPGQFQETRAKLGFFWQRIAKPLGSKASDLCALVYDG